MVEIKSMENASRASDRDPTTSIFYAFYYTCDVNSSEVRHRLVIRQPRLNGNDPMRFIRAVDRGLNGDRTVTPKLS